MALRNTSERYEYIYGSNVRKLETDTAGKQTAKAVPAKKNLRRPEQRRTGNKAADSEAAKTYVNVIAVKEGNENSEKIKALVDVLKSDSIKKFINEKYDGAVIVYDGE